MPKPSKAPAPPPKPPSPYKPEWTIEDYTGANAGYLRIFRKGQRVADIFPFARDDNPERVIADAQELVRIANEYQPPEEV